MNKKSLILFLLFSLAAFAQKPVLTSIDTTKNKIGAQFNLTLKTTVDTSALVVFPSGKQFGKLEVIRNYVVDTIKKDDKYELVKSYGLTQFDSGKYTIPSLKVLINKKQFATDSIKIEVANVAVDTLKQKMYDIKDVIPAEGEGVPWWAYILIAILFAEIIYFTPKIHKKYKRTKKEIAETKTPIEKATVLLKQLEQKELWQKGEIKHYYSELTDIARVYIEEAVHIPAMESTTSELIVALRIAAVKKHMSLTQETVENLEKVLMQADLVKFAKSKPLDFEIADDRKKIESAIIRIDNSIPVIEEEENTEEQDELARLQRLKKQKMKKIYNVAGFIIAFAIAFFIGMVVTKGFAYVRENVLGNATKELLEGEWVTSEYGNPLVSIKTPKVLTRIVDENNKKSMFNDTQKFAYGSNVDKFSIILTTSKYKDPLKIKDILDKLVAETDTKF
jgi:hypothetical protein